MTEQAGRRGKMRCADDVRGGGGREGNRGETPVRAVVLIAAVFLALALPGSRSRAGQDVQPSPQAPEIPSFEEVKVRMVAAFRKCDNLNLHAGGKTVFIRARAEGREAWEMMTRAVEGATPGWVLGHDPEVSINADSGEPEWDWFIFSYTEPILGSDRPEYGGNRRTLKVGPEFAEGLDRLYETAGADVGTAGERGGRRWRKPVPISVGTPPEEAVPAERAIAEAKRVAEGIDVPFGEGAVATWRDARGIQRPRWEVEFKEFSAISVSPSGRVTGVMNCAGVDALMLPTGEPTMAEEQALRIAVQAVRVVGGPEDLRFEGASLTAHIDGIPQWRVRWRQVWRGIPYEQVFDVVVAMDAATGAILLGGAPEAPLPPQSTEVRISEAEARAIALEHIERNGLVLAEPEFAAEVEIAQPEFTWAANSPDSRWDDPTRVVWRVEIGRSDEELGWAPYAVVYVDAGTGEVVGDAISGMGAAAARPQAAKGKGASLLAVGGGVLVALIAGAAAFLWVRRGR